MNETKVLMLPTPPHHTSNAMRKHKSASSLGGSSSNRSRLRASNSKETNNSNRAYPLNSLPLPPQLATESHQPPSDHDECEPMLLSSSSSSVITTSTAAGNGAYEATTLYSDYPLDKEQRWREDRERLSVHIVGPLPHQCAGHETVFRTTDGQICKPLDETEFWFYKICLREFPRYKPFVPAWHGCVLLSRKKLLLLINSLADDDDDSSSSSGDDEPMELQAGGGGVFDTLRSPVPRVGSPASPGTWSLLLSEEFRLKLELDDMPSSSAPSRSGPRTYPYIVLEDLTAGYDFPCTLDIKMGTKDLHHQISTSTTLGLRIMGMQVYEPAAHTYRQFDKLQGRQLVNETVPYQLAQFVTQTIDGVPVLRCEVLRVFIEKLKALLAVLRQETTVQIQNSSILLVFEGRVRPSGAMLPAKADVRMIDFQHVQLSSPNPELRSPTVLSPPTTRRRRGSVSSSSSSSASSSSSGDEDSIGDDSEDGVGGSRPESDAEGLVWGFSNLISLLEAALSRASSS